MARQMQSSSRRRKRKDKGAANGKPVPLHERKVVESMLNDGGFYDGMPGVSIDKKGNRRIMNFVVTPEGDSNAYIFAHPRIVKTAIEDSMNHKEVRALIMSAVVDRTFKKKFNPLYFLLRVAFKMKKRASASRLKRKQRKEEKNNENGEQL